MISVFESPNLLASVSDNYYALCNILSVGHYYYYFVVDSVEANKTVVYGIISRASFKMTRCLSVLIWSVDYFRNSVLCTRLYV